MFYSRLRISSADGRFRAAPWRSGAVALAIAALVTLLAAPRTLHGPGLQPDQRPRRAAGVSSSGSGSDSGSTAAAGATAARTDGVAAVVFVPQHHAPCDQLTAGMVQHVARNNTVMLTGELKNK
jgi:hypothetical protein